MALQQPDALGWLMRLAPRPASAALWLSADYCQQSFPRNGVRAGRAAAAASDPSPCRISPFRPEDAPDHPRRSRAVRPSPRDDLIGPDQRERRLVACQQVGIGQSDHAKVHADRGRFGGEAGRLVRPVGECEQGPLGVEGVEQRAAVGQPGVRRAPAGTGARHVLVRPVGRRCGAVADDHRRAVVATADRDAGNVELGAAVGRQVAAGDASRRRTGGRVVLDLRHRLESAERIRETLGIAGIAFRERPALGAVAVEQRGRRPAGDQRGELPAEVDRVLDGGVVAEAAGRREEVRRVAAQGTGQTVGRKKRTWFCKSRCHATGSRSAVPSRPPRRRAPAHPHRSVSPHVRERGAGCGRRTPRVRPPPP